MNMLNVAQCNTKVRPQQCTCLPMLPMAETECRALDTLDSGSFDKMAVSSGVVSISAPYRKVPLCGSAHGRRLIIFTTLHFLLQESLTCSKN